MGISVSVRPVNTMSLPAFFVPVKWYYDYCINLLAAGLKPMCSKIVFNSLINLIGKRIDRNVKISYGLVPIADACEHLYAASKVVTNLALLNVKSQNEVNIFCFKTLP